MTEPSDAWDDMPDAVSVEQAQHVGDAPVTPEPGPEDSAILHEEKPGRGSEPASLPGPYDRAGDDALDFLVTASEAAAMVTERLGRKTTPATFRRMAIDREAPAPVEQDDGDGKTIKWSQNTLDAWLDDLTAETDAAAVTGTAEVEAAPDGKDFYLSAAEAAALLSESTPGKITVAGFRRMVLAGDAPAPMVQAGGTAKWSQAALDAWAAEGRHLGHAGQLTDPLEDDATGFMLGVDDVLALVAERAEQITASTWRSLVMDGKAPAPMGWEPALWGFEAVDAWIQNSLESGLLQPKAPEAQLVFGSTGEWVEKFLVPTYRRQLSGNGEKGTWCPKWWKHAEAIIRLEALWRAWEHLRLDASTGMSVWLKDHLDHHLPILIDSDGPFRGCTTTNGHAEQPGGLQPFAHDAPPPALFPDVREPRNDNQGDKS